MIRFLLLIALLFPVVADAATWTSTRPDIYDRYCDGYDTWQIYHYSGTEWRIQARSTSFGTTVQHGSVILPGGYGWATISPNCVLNNGDFGNWRNVVTAYDADPNAEPSYCSNGVRDWDDTNEVWLEDGIDCGGNCASPDNTCTQYCPVGFHIENRPPTNLDVCYSDDNNVDGYTVDAKLGVCPTNYYKSATDPDKCISAELITLGSADLLDPEPVTVADTTPWNNIYTQDTTNITSTSNIVDGVTTNVTTETTTTTDTESNPLGESSVETTEVIQADGSKTVTETTTTTTQSPSGGVRGSTQTVVKNYDSGGNLTGSTTTNETIGSDEGEVNGALQNFGGADGDFVVDAEKGGQFASRFQTFKTTLESAPIYAPVNSLFSGPDTSSKSPTASIGMGSYGSVSFDLSGFDTALNVLGYLFVLLACYAAARIVMINGV